MLNERVAESVGPSGIDIVYEELGDRGYPTALLIMGLGGQLVHWPTGFLDALRSRNLHIIRFDNRDSGRSTHFNNAPMPNLTAALAGDFSSVSYTLSDMAADAIGLLDILEIQAAHVIGASMGAAIAQVMAIEYPHRVRSLTSMMFTTGAPSVGQMHSDIKEKVFAVSPATTKEEAIAQAIRRASIVRSPAYPTSSVDIAKIAGIAWERDHDTLSVARQAVANIASGDRTGRLRSLNTHTLVIHGAQDVICDVSGGQATAEAIPGAELVLIEGMGHDLPAAQWNNIADHIAALVRRGEMHYASASHY